MLIWKKKCPSVTYEDLVEMTYDGVMLTFVPIFLMLYKKIKWQDNRKGLPYNGHFASLLYVLSFNTLYSKKRKCFSLSYLFKLRILKPEQNGKRSKSGHFGLYLKLLVSSSPPHPKRKKKWGPGYTFLEVLVFLHLLPVSRIILNLYLTVC